MFQDLINLQNILKPNFISYLIYRIGKDDASGLAAQMTYHFVLALFPMLIFLLTLLPLFQIDPQQVKDMVSQNAPAETASVVSKIFNDITKMPVVVFYQWV